MAERDPLEELLLDEEAVDRSRLAQTLNGILGVDSKSGKLVQQRGYASLTSRQRVLAYLLGAKAAQLLGLTDSGEMTTKEIIEQSGMPRGTVSAKLSELSGERMVSQAGSRGAYYVSGPQMLHALQEFDTGSSR